MNVFNKQNNKFLNKNKFNKKPIIGKKLFDDTKEELEIDNALKSIHLPVYCFSNFLKSEKDVMFKFVRSEYKKMNNINYNIFEHFELKNVDFNRKNISQEKVSKITEETFGSKMQINMIYRFKNLSNPAFQLYISKQNNDDFKVIIIDLYHLVIPAADKSKGRKTADLKADYDDVKNYNVCLSNIKK